MSSTPNRSPINEDARDNAKSITILSHRIKVIKERGLMKYIRTFLILMMVGVFAHVCGTGTSRLERI